MRTKKTLKKTNKYYVCSFLTFICVGAVRTWGYWSKFGVWTVEISLGLGVWGAWADIQLGKLGVIGALGVWGIRFLNDFIWYFF